MQTESLTPNDLKDLITSVLVDRKAQDIVTIDLAGKTAMADFLVIATGTSQRHVGAMADILYHDLKSHLQVGIEGIPQCDWVLIDAGAVVVHLFRAEARAFYALEKLWGTEAP